MAAKAVVRCFFSFVHHLSYVLMFHNWCAAYTMSTGCQSKLPNGNVGVSEKCMRFTRGTTISSLLPQPSLVLIVSTGLLVLLFLSAAFLLYRIGRIHSQFAESSIHAGRSVMYVYCFSNKW